MSLYCGTHMWMCVQKMLNHGLNHGFFLLLFKLLSCPIHWIVCVLAYLNFIFELVLVMPKTASSGQTHKSICFIWIVWSTLYVYLWLRAYCPYNRYCVAITCEAPYWYKVSTWLSKTSVFIQQHPLENTINIVCFFSNNTTSFFT